MDTWTSQVVATINCIAFNIYICDFLQTCLFISFKDILKSGNSRLCVKFMLSFLRNYQTFLKYVPFYIPASNVWEFQFLYTRINTWYYLLYYSPSSGY